MRVFLVTGVGGPAGKSVSKLLVERGQRVVGTDNRLTGASDIRFFQVPAAKDPAFLFALHAIALQAQVDIIIPTVSEELPVIARGWQWRQVFPVLVSPAPAVEIANDKYLTAQALSDNGVPVPRFALPSETHAPEDVARLVGWPCISKPRVGRGGHEVTLHQEQSWAAVATKDDRYILQEFASGSEFVSNVFVGPRGALKVIVLKKPELSEGQASNGKPLQRVEVPAVAEVAAEAAGAFGLSGPLEINIRLRKDGTPVVLGINARFGANIGSAPEIMEAVLKTI